jgi:DNA-binding transcriptional MerR regulator
MVPSLTISQVAKTSGVAAKTIRYYEEIGVLPAPSRAASGYRLYDQPGVERLRFIRRARSLGLPLQQLKILMGTLSSDPHLPFRPRLHGVVDVQNLPCNFVPNSSRMRFKSPIARSSV